MPFRFKDLTEKADFQMRQIGSLADDNVQRATNQVQGHIDSAVKEGLALVGKK